MSRLLLAAMLAFGAAAANAQPTVKIEPSPDSAEQRKALQKLSSCLAEARPRWARNTLARPYLSDGQASVAALALRGRDSCIHGEAEVTFRNSGMVGSLAEHFLRTDLERADAESVAHKLATLPPLNASEDFALCVASRNPAAARSLMLSEPGSSDENAAVGKFMVYLEPCTQDHEQLTIDLQSLRALVATALYRSVTAVLNSGS